MVRQNKNYGVHDIIKELQNDTLSLDPPNTLGVSIAFSVAEQLLASSAYTLFVTHYPQLTSLSTMYSNVKNVHLRTSIDISPQLSVPFHGVGSSSGQIPNAAPVNPSDQQPNQRMKFLYQVTGGPCDMKSG